MLGAVGLALWSGGTTRADPLAGGDVTEDITFTPEPAPPPPSAPAAPQDIRVDMSGWSLVSNELIPGTSAAGPDDPPVPHDRWIGRLQLLGRMRYALGRSFELGVSGLVSYSMGQAAAASAPVTGVGQGTSGPWGEAESQLRELYLGFYLRAVDVRIGQQRLAWGRSEFINPNDVMNPRDARNPFVNEAELNRLPSPLLRVDVALAGTTLQVAAAPIFVPDRYDLFGSNWAAVQPDAPANLRALTHVLANASDPSLRSRLQPVLAQTALPAANLTAPILGGKLSWQAAGIDVSHYYQYGFDGPALAVAPALLQSHPEKASDLAPLLAAIDAGALPLQAVYLRRHHLGLDAAVPWGPVVLRTDLAYQSRKVFYLRDFQSLSAPVVQGVLGLEYQSGDPDKLAMVEVYGLEILQAEVPGLMFYKPDTYGISSLLRWSLTAQIGGELRASVGLRPQMVVLQPQLYWKRAPLTVLLGALYLDGQEHSFGAYYRHNAEIYLKAKAGF